MTKRVLHWLEWLLVGGAYAFLGYKLATFENYALLAENFRQANGIQYAWLADVILLMFLNVTLETCKWQQLVQHVVHLPFVSALKSVLVGWAAAFITPNRVGELPGRTLCLPPGTRWQSMALGSVGSLVQTVAIICFGLPACLLFWKQIYHYSPQTLLMYLIMLVLLSSILFYAPNLCRYWAQRCQNDKIKQILIALSGLNKKQFALICLCTSLRYLIFCLQFFATLRFFGINLTIYEALIAIPTYYLFVTITPSISIAEAAVRGSWAMVVLAHFTHNSAGVALAAILLWFINCVVPMLAGVLIRPKKSVE